MTILEALIRPADSFEAETTLKPNVFIFKFEPPPNVFRQAIRMNMLVAVNPVQVEDVICAHVPTPPEGTS